MEKTLLYHYTSLSHLIEIFKVGKVLTSQTEKMLKVKKPGLWFSTNNKWEYSAFKRFNDGNKEFDLNTPEEFWLGSGENKVYPSETDEFKNDINAISLSSIKLIDTFMEDNNAS